MRAIGTASKSGEYYVVVMPQQQQQKWKTTNSSRKKLCCQTYGIVWHASQFDSCYRPLTRLMKLVRCCRYVLFLLLELQCHWVFVAIVTISFLSLLLLVRWVVSPPWNHFSYFSQLISPLACLWDCKVIWLHTITPAGQWVWTRVTMNGIFLEYSSRNGKIDAEY